jgi:hypothetical protein
MSTVRAYCDGISFVPIEPFEMPKGKVVELSVAADDLADSEIAKKLAAFERITKEIHEINKTDPLPPEFDEILAKRVNFSRELDL